MAHIAGIWFLLKAGTHLTLVVYSDMLEAMADPYGYGSPYSTTEIMTARLRMLIFAAWVSVIAKVLGIVISFFVSSRNGWYWVNSLIAGIVLWLLVWLFDFNPLTAVFGLRNNIINSVFIQHFLFMIVYLLFALAAFFLPALKRWIDKDYKREDVPGFQFEQTSP